MRSSLDRWSRRLLLFACAGYWLALLLVMLGPPVIAAWRVLRPDSGHGFINASVDGTTLRIAMASAHTAPWTGVLELWTFVLWGFGPPIVLWLALRGLQQRRRSVLA